MKTKPFDLEAAKRGDPICRKDGEALTFIAHVPAAKEHMRVLAHDPEGVVWVFDEMGCSHYGLSAFMAVKTKAAWLIVIPNVFYDTEQAAMDAMPSTVLRTVSVEVAS